MNITNVPDYDNMVDAYNNNLSTNNCTTNDYIIDLIIPSLILTIPCGLSFLCLMSLMVYTIIEALLNIK